MIARTRTKSIQIRKEKVDSFAPLLGDAVLLLHSFGLLGHLVGELSENANAAVRGRLLAARRAPRNGAKHYPACDRRMNDAGGWERQGAGLQRQRNAPAGCSARMRPS